MVSKELKQWIGDTGLLDTIGSGNEMPSYSAGAFVLVGGGSEVMHLMLPQPNRQCAWAKM